MSRQRFLARHLSIGGLIFVLALVSSGLLYFKMANKQEAMTLQTMPAYNRLGNFELLNQNAEAVTNKQLLGKVWLANFIFTRCSGPCPKMTKEFREIQKGLKSEKIGLLTFSVDPQYDKPEILKKYASRFEADFSNWIFLTGAQQQIHDLSIQHFLLGVSEIPEEERDELSQGFNHSTKFALIDQQGQIRGYYDSSDPHSINLLVKHAHMLTKNIN